MSDKLIIYGHPVSPFVRKVLIALDIKGARPDEMRPVTPFLAREELVQYNPLMRVPVWIQGDLVIPDSSVISEYIDEIYEGVALYPSDPKAKARARWFEEYADSHIAGGAVFDLFFQRVIRPAVLKEESDEQKIATAIEVTLPEILDYLEANLQESAFLVGDSAYMPDFAVGCYFVNAGFAGWSINDEKWPLVAAYYERLQHHPSFAKITAFSAKALTSRRAELDELIAKYLAG